jgi:biopolymer transport protein ExbD
MRFKSQQQSNQLPEVNLVPMMDVVMTILTFFIIVSMTLTRFESVDVPLPSADAGTSSEQPVEPLVIGLNRQGQAVISNAPVTDAQMAEQVVDYLNKNPKGVVVLKADKSLAYEKVVQLLGTLRDVGGDRVSLAVD